MKEKRNLEGRRKIIEKQSDFAKKWLLWQIPLLLFVLVYALAYRHALSVGSAIFSCRIASTLHIYCPGCGGSRALSALLRGKILSSLRYYAPLPLAAFLLLLSDLRMLLFLCGKGSFPSRRFGYGAMILCIAAVFLQFIIRNIFLFQGIDLLGDIIPR